MTQGYSDADSDYVRDADAADTVAIDDLGEPDDVGVVTAAWSADLGESSDGTDAEAADGEASLDDAFDDDLDSVDDGSRSVREPVVMTTASLPFAVSVRDALSRLDNPPATGDARVDAALARLGELVDLPSGDHADVYEDVLGRLQGALADADAH
ncbi:MAG: hypothetical protein WCI29_06230 [Actinomycetes bacterium]